MRTKRRGSVVRRLLGALSGALLLMAALAGPALAQDESTTTPAAPTTSSSSTTRATGTSGASGASGASGTSGADSTMCAQVASQLTGLLGEIASLSSELDALPAPSPLAAPLTDRIETLNSQADAVSQQLADAFCSLVPAGGGTEPDSETIFPTTDYPVRYFDGDPSSSYSAYGDDYSSEPSEVVATQVASVPSGGVDTGDGTFGP